jgi:hypothetical protein
MTTLLGIGTRLWAAWPGVCIPAGARDFSLLQNAENGCGAHPSFYSMGTGFFPGLKRPGSEVDQSPPYSAEVKNEWSYTSSPPISFHDVDREKLYVYELFSRFSFRNSVWVYYTCSSRLFNLLFDTHKLRTSTLCSSGANILHFPHCALSSFQYFMVFVIKSKQ